MTCDPIFTTFCDYPDCLRWEAERATRVESRAAARRAGWVRKKFGTGSYPRPMDLCPAHASTVVWPTDD